MSFREDIAALVEANAYGALASGDGWPRKPMGEVARIINGFAFESKYFSVDKGAPLVRIRDVVEGNSGTRYSGPIPDGYAVENGDLLVGMDGDFNSAYWKGGSALLNQRVCKIAPDETRLRTKFLAYALPAYLRLINDHTSSVTVKHLSSRTLQALPIPLPAVEIQDGIVARIDELFAEIDDGERALSLVRSNTEIYRKSLLKAAMTGGLTATWRTLHEPTETGAALVQRIIAQCDSKGRTERRPPKASAPSTAPVAPLSSAELPKGWHWARLEQLICEGPTNGYSPKSSQRSTGTPSLKLTATSGGEMRLGSDCVKVLDEKIQAGSGLFLRTGDLLFQRGNTPELVGIAAIYDGPRETFIYPDLMIRVRTVDPILTRWLWRWANSPHGRAHMMSNAQGAAGSMPKISGSTVRGMPVPVGPWDEMAHALELLEDALAKIDLRQIESDLMSAASLRQSILAAAFRGDLVA